MSDLRSAALRIASELPAGDPTRRELLAVLKSGQEEWVTDGQEFADILSKKWRHAKWDERRGRGEAKLGGLEITWVESGNDPAVIIQITKHPRLKGDPERMANALERLGKIYSMA